MLTISKPLSSTQAQTYHAKAYLGRGRHIISISSTLPLFTEIEFPRYYANYIQAHFGFRPNLSFYIGAPLYVAATSPDSHNMAGDLGVACVPGSSFYSRPELGAQQVRFCFCKKDETLLAAAERLSKLR